MEAISTKTNDARVVTKFFKKIIFPRFSCPRIVINDNGIHFIDHKFESVVRKYGALHRFAIPYHPQTSGEVEVSNRELKVILEKTVHKSRKTWSNKLDNAFWDYRTAFKTPIMTTPFELIYGKHCHLPIVRASSPFGH